MHIEQIRLNNICVELKCVRRRLGISTTLCPSSRLYVIVTSSRLHISDELPHNACVIYGIVAKHMFYGYLQGSTQSTGSDITSNLEIGQSVGAVRSLKLHH